MKIFGLEFGKKTEQRGVSKKRALTVRAAGQRFAGAQMDNLTASFGGSHLSINEELRRSLQRMQYRSRTLCMDNDYMRKFMSMVKANVIGPNGIKLQCQFQNDRGVPDLADQKLVEKTWQQWAKRRNCSIDGRLSWHEMQNLVIQTIARDGEVLIQKIRQRNSRYKLKLRVLECDHLDVNHNTKLPGDRRIIMGVEVDKNDQPLAYWLTSQHPGEYGTHTHIKRRRVPADEILHLFITERPGQVRGIPWVHSAIRRLNQLGGYEEAELVAARAGASKMGFYTSPDGTVATASEMAGDGQESDDYDLVEEITPGLLQSLPEGTTFTPFDPQHPTSAFPDFTKAVLRGASSGLNVAYNTLANDLEGVNFSSIRSGVLEEREQWRMLQNWLADVMHDDIYREWLELNVDFGALSMLPANKLDTKFADVQWQPRGWDWVDPAKDIKSATDEYHLGTTSLTEICAKKGRSLDDVLRQRQADDALAKTYGQTVGQIVNQMNQNTGGDNEPAQE